MKENLSWEFHKTSAVVSLSFTHFISCRLLLPNISSLSSYLRLNEIQRKLYVSVLFAFAAVCTVFLYQRCFFISCFISFFSC